MREVDLHTERWAVFEAILAGAGIDDSIRLNRRHRWKPLAAHVDDEDAVILWAYRQRKEGTELRVDQFSRLAGRSITGDPSYGRWRDGGTAWDVDLDTLALPSRPPMRPSTGMIDDDTFFASRPLAKGRSRSGGSTRWLAFQAPAGLTTMRCGRIDPAIPDHGFIIRLLPRRPDPITLHATPIDPDHDAHTGQSAATSSDDLDDAPTIFTVPVERWVTKSEPKTPVPVRLFKAVSKLQHRAVSDPDGWFNYGPDC